MEDDWNLIDLPEPSEVAQNQILMEEVQSSANLPDLESRLDFEQMEEELAKRGPISNPRV